LSLLVAVAVAVATTRTAAAALVVRVGFALALWQCLLARRTRSLSGPGALEARPGQTLAILAAIRCFRPSPAQAAAEVALTLAL
jgi:hypothetical protein